MHLPHNSGFDFFKLFKLESNLKLLFFLEHILQASEYSLIFSGLLSFCDFIMEAAFINFSMFPIKESKLPKSITSKSMLLSKDLKLVILKLDVLMYGYLSFKIL